MENQETSVHLVGSIPLADAESVFEAVAHTLGDKVKRIPDGETGDRSNWIAWQLPLLEANSHMEADPEIAEPSHVTAEDGLAVDDRQFRFLRIRPGVDDEDLNFRSEYAEHAIASFKSFAKLQEEGNIPKGVRFQVSLPTPYAVASLYVASTSWPQFLPAYERAIMRDLKIIVANIPSSLLAVQWDVCMEVMAWEGKLQSPGPNLESFTFESIGRLCDGVPPEVQVGIHLCYGDPGHKHIVEPKDARILVALANGISKGTRRSLNWIHMPVPKERDDDDYFAALKSLDLDSECELYLGLVHFTDQDEGATRRIAAARRVVKNFGIATECGFGRRPADTVIPLLELHQRCCAIAEHEADAQG